MRFSPQELIDVAIGIEETGYYFYSKFREKMEDKAFKEIFGFLAEEELRHKDIFQRMLSNIPDKSGYFTEEYYSYLRALGNSRVFRNKNDIDKMLPKIDTFEEIIRLGLDAERDSILWYTELREMYQDDPDSVTILNNLINEERRHVVTLLELKEKFESQ